MIGLILVQSDLGRPLFQLDKSPAFPAINSRPRYSAVPACPRALPSFKPLAVSPDQKDGLR